MPPAPSFVQGSSTLGEAIHIGTRPLRLQLTAVSANVDDILESVRDILVKVELLSRGQERLAMAVSCMQGAVSVGFKDNMDGLKQMSVGVDGGAPTSNAQQAEVLAKVQSVKRAFRAQFVKRMAEATSSNDVYLDTGRT